MTENSKAPWSRPWGFLLAQTGKRHPRIYDALFPPCSPVLRTLQAKLSRHLGLNGFRRHGRHFNRLTEDGLVQVLSFQSGVRWMEGEFTVNLGIVIPELHKAANDWPSDIAYRDVDCALSTRLGELDPEPDDLWWPIEPGDWLVRELTRRLQDHAFPFFARFNSRELCLTEFLTGSFDWELGMGIEKVDVERALETHP